MKLGMDSSKSCFCQMSARAWSCSYQDEKLRTFERCHLPAIYSSFWVGQNHEVLLAQKEVTTSAPRDSLGLKIPQQLGHFPQVSVSKISLCKSNKWFNHTHLRFVFQVLQESFTGRKTNPTSYIIITAMGPRCIKWPLPICLKEEQFSPLIL